MYTTTGHHHISMMTKDANINYHFYTEIMGFRLVNKTVNQDEPTMYHLFYGDKTGSPGTELTFFEMPNLGQTHHGTNAITRIGLLVPNEESLNYWEERFTEMGVEHSKVSMYANRKAVHFKDPDGLHLVLLAGNGEEAEQWQAWSGSTVPEPHQIRGMGTIEITVKRLDKLANLLTEVFGYKESFRSKDEAIFQADAHNSTGEILVKQVEGNREKPGRGSVHHLAIRAKNEEEMTFWEDKVKKIGFRSTNIIDRYYFKSMYFRESNGILIEIATDGPGFTIDKDEKELGRTLSLPPFLEDRRTEIESKLQPIKTKE